MTCPGFALQFTLARELGRTVEELWTGRPGPLMQRELNAWMIYRRYYPFGPDVDDERFADGMALFVNAHRSPHSRAARREDFLRGRRIGRPSTPEEEKARFRRAALLTGGQVIEKRSQP